MAATADRLHSVADSTELQIVGAGPAGIGMVLALCNRVAANGDDAAMATNLLRHLRVFETAARPGGVMGQYRVNANTSSHDVVQGIADGTPFVAIRDAYLAHPDTQDELIPLQRIDQLMVQPLAQAMTEYLGERLQCATRVDRIELDGDGFTSYTTSGTLLATSPDLLLCCGASDAPLAALEAWRDRWQGSAAFLLRDNLDELSDADGPVVIVGASHSAFSCAWRLLYDPLFSDYSRGREIVILQRREAIKLRGTPEFAAAHRIDYDPEKDLCPYTGLVFRNGGLRKDAKMLYLKIRDGKEDRVRILRIENLREQAALLDAAALILQATGFSSRLPPIERDGRRLRVGDPTVCGELRDLDRNEVIPGLYGMGLGLNVVPPGPPRGEPSFYGGIHGFQSYPLSIAPHIIDSLLARRATEQVIEN